MTTRKYVHILEISAQFWVYPLTGYIYVKIRHFYRMKLRKEALKNKIFCPENSQLRCVIVRKHILTVLYMHSYHISI